MKDLQQPSIKAKTRRSPGKSDSALKLRIRSLPWILSCVTLGLGATLCSLAGSHCTIVPTSDTISPVVTSNAARNPQKHQHRYPWPSQPVEELGHPLVQKGSNFVLDMRTLLFSKPDDDFSRPVTISATLFDEFLQVYKNRPDKVNICGIRINHALALYTAVRILKPSLVIESGVNAGQSTYFIRQAAPLIKIMAIDPLEQPICGQEKRWMDTSGNTEYLTGEKFKDIYDIDWKGMAERNEFVPEKTLAFLDDHLPVLTRIPALLKAGIRHIIVEDNYEYGKGATMSDKAGLTPKQLFAQDTINSNWFFHNVVSYTEFPPIVPSIMAKESPEEIKEAGGFMVASDDNLQTMEPILRPDVDAEDLALYQNMSQFLEIDPMLKDNLSYMQFMNYNFICYFEAVSIPPILVGKW